MGPVTPVKKEPDKVHYIKTEIILAVGLKRR